MSPPSAGGPDNSESGGCVQPLQTRSARRAAAARPAAARAGLSGPRETLSQARRYSVFVRFMKRALPLAALGLALAVLAYAVQPRQTGQIAMTFERVGTLESDLTMVNPRLTGTDDNGLPFTIRASSAVQLGETMDRVRLENVAAELRLRDGTRLDVTAAEGIVDNATRMLDVYGGIRLVTESGYSAETASAHADLGTGIVSGVSPVSAAGAFGDLTAAGFRFERDTGLLHFTGGVKMQIRGALQ